MAQSRKQQEEEFDVTKLDPASQRAFQYAVEFYEKDHTLTPNQRSLLANTYSTISYTTLGIGWATFFAITSIPFYRQKLRTGSTKGTNVGLAILGGMGGLMFASPFAAHKAYNWQLEKLRDQDTKCYEVAAMLKPAESTKWWMYYKLTMDHPEHVMKDPRSKEAAEQRKKTIYSGRDPMGLYSGPRAEMNKRRLEQLPDADKVGAGAVAGAAMAEATTEEDEDDPFAEKKETVSSYSSAWDRVRHTNGIDSDDESSSWGKIRHHPQQPMQNPYTTNIYRAKEQVPDEVEDQSDFDKLLDKERHIGEEESTDKW